MSSTKTQFRLIKIFGNLQNVIKGLQVWQSIKKENQKAITHKTYTSNNFPSMNQKGNSDDISLKTPINTLQFCAFLYVYMNKEDTPTRKKIFIKLNKTE